MTAKRVLVQRLITAAVVATGAGTLWAVVVGWLAHTVYDLSRQAVEQHTIRWYDGKPVVQLHQPGDNAVIGYRDLEGNTLPKPDSRRWTPGAELRDTRVRQQTFFEMSWDRRIVAFHDGGEPPRYWYFLDDGRAEGSGYFAIFDSSSKRCVGYLGRAGMRTDPPPQDERFRLEGGPLRSVAALVWQWESTFARIPSGQASGRYSPGYFGYREALVASGNEVFQVDSVEGSVKSLCTLLQPVLSLEDVIIVDKGNWGDQFMAVRTPDNVHLVDRAGKVRESWPIPPEARQRQLLFIRGAGPTAAIVTTERKGSRTLWRFWRVDQAGVVEETKAIELQETQPQLYESIGQRTLRVILIPVPVAHVIMTFISQPLALLVWNDATTFANAAAASVFESWPAVAATLLVSAVLAGVVWRRQARYAASTSEQWAWPAFVLLFGLPGLVGYWTHRRWPTFERCLACDRPTPMDRDGCAWCGTAHPEPGPTGAEIFADAGLPSTGAEGGA